MHVNTASITALNETRIMNYNIEFPSGINKDFLNWIELIASSFYKKKRAQLHAQNICNCFYMLNFVKVRKHVFFPIEN